MQKSVRISAAAVSLALLPAAFSSEVGGVSLGGLTDHLFVFANGSEDANWQGATKGFAGDVAVRGSLARERTSGSVPFAGTIFTDDSTLSAWQSIVNQNPGQASASLAASVRLTSLQSDLANAFAEINGLAVTPGFESRSAASLSGLNTQNGIGETIVINVTSGLQVSSRIDITGDATDAFILRWDTDANPANGYQGEVKFQSGGAIVPHGGLSAANFVHVAGDINASGGGSTPPAPFPQGPRLNDGQGALIQGGADFGGGGFFTGYWLTTGDPASGDTHSLSNAIFVGGWYTTSDKFSLTSGTSGVHVTPPAPNPRVSIRKNGPGPDVWSVLPGSEITFEIEIRNIGNVELRNIQIEDARSPHCSTSLDSLPAGQRYSYFCTLADPVDEKFLNVACVRASAAGATVEDCDSSFVLVVPCGASGCAADLDGDLAVTLSDLSILLSNFGIVSGATREQGDIWCDGNVDIADLSVLLGGFGSRCD